MPSPFRCRVVTPAASLLDEQAEYASIPAHDGLLGVVAGRAPLIAELGLGVMRVDFPADAGKPGGSRRYLIEGGVLRIADDEVLILADAATPAENLSLQDEQAELDAAIAASPEPGPEQLEQADALRARQDRGRIAVKLASNVQSSGI